MFQLPNLADVRDVYASEAKKFEFLVHLGHFSKFLKYFKYFEKRSKWTKNLDFFASEAYNNSLQSFWAKLGYSCIKIDHIADYLLKDAVLTVGVNLRLSSFSVDLSCICWG